MRPAQKQRTEIHRVIGVLYDLQDRLTRDPGAFKYDTDFLRAVANAITGTFPNSGVDTQIRIELNPPDQEDGRIWVLKHLYGLYESIQDGTCAIRNYDALARELELLSHPNRKTPPRDSDRPVQHRPLVLKSVGQPADPPMSDRDVNRIESSKAPAFSILEDDSPTVSLTGKRLGTLPLYADRAAASPTFAAQAPDELDDSNSNDSRRSEFRITGADLLRIAKEQDCNWGDRHSKEIKKIEKRLLQGLIGQRIAFPGTRYIGSDGIPYIRCLKFGFNEMTETFESVSCGSNPSYFDVNELRLLVAK